MLLPSACKYLLGKMIYPHQTPKKDLNTDHQMIHYVHSIVYSMMKMMAGSNMDRPKHLNYTSSLKNRYIFIIYLILNIDSYTLLI